jgi:hypothetical protein
MKKAFKLLFVVSILFLYTSSINAQGQIMSASDANNLFGPALQSVVISASTLKTLVGQSSGTIGFNIVGGQLVVLNNNRQVLLSQNSSLVVKPTDVYMYYSTSVVLQFLSASNASQVTVEVRANNIISVSAVGSNGGVITMEVGKPCPPFC